MREKALRRLTDWDEEEDNRRLARAAAPVKRKKTEAEEAEEKVRNKNRPAIVPPIEGIWKNKDLIKAPLVGVGGKIALRSVFEKRVAAERAAMAARHQRALDAAGGNPGLTKKLEDDYAVAKRKDANNVNEKRAAEADTRAQVALEPHSRFAPTVRKGPENPAMDCPRVLLRAMARAPFAYDVQELGCRILTVFAQHDRNNARRCVLLGADKQTMELVEDKKKFPAAWMSATLQLAIKTLREALARGQDNRHWLRIDREKEELRQRKIAEARAEAQARAVLKERAEVRYRQRMRERNRLQLIRERKEAMKARLDKYANHHALIVTVEKYDNFKQLPPTVTADGDGLAATLSNWRFCGFPAKNVRHLMDPNMAECLTALDELAKQTDPEKSTVLIYFACHGRQSSRNLYITARRDFLCRTLFQIERTALHSYRVYGLDPHSCAVLSAIS